MSFGNQLSKRKKNEAKSKDEKILEPERRYYEFLKDDEAKREIHYAECKDVKCMKESSIIHLIYDTWFGKICCICGKMPEEKIMNFGSFTFCYVCADEAFKDLIKKKTTLLKLE